MCSISDFNSLSSCSVTSHTCPHGGDRALMDGRTGERGMDKNIDMNTEVVQSRKEESFNTKRRRSRSRHKSSSRTLPSDGGRIW